MKDGNSNYPKWAINLLGKFCPAHLLEEIEGDLLQKFNRDVEAFGGKKANLSIVLQALDNRISSLEPLIPKIAHHLNSAFPKKGIIEIRS